jgi:hypothetical protein
MMYASGSSATAVKLGSLGTNVRRGVSVNQQSPLGNHSLGAADLRPAGTRAGVHIGK